MIRLITCPMVIECRGMVLGSGDFEEKKTSLKDWRLSFYCYRLDDLCALDEVLKRMDWGIIDLLVRFT